MLVERYVNDRLNTTTVRKATLPGGERVNKGRSPTTVRKEVVLLSAIFNMAKQERLVAENRCDFIRQSVRIKTGFASARHGASRGRAQVRSAAPVNAPKLLTTQEIMCIKPGSLD